MLQSGWGSTDQSTHTNSNFPVAFRKHHVSNFQCPLSATWRQLAMSQLVLKFPGASICLPQPRYSVPLPDSSTLRPYSCGPKKTMQHPRGPWPEYLLAVADLQRSQGCLHVDSVLMFCPKPPLPTRGDTPASPPAQREEREVHARVWVAGCLALASEMWYVVTRVWLHGAMPKHRVMGVPGWV